MWERILEAYPDWRATTNIQLAAIYGVHPNVIASRRKALAAIQHVQINLETDSKDEDGTLMFVLNHCLRLRIWNSPVRKTDIARVESQIGDVSRKSLVEKTRVVRTEILMDWGHGSHKGAAFGTPVPIPIYASLETPGFIRPSRCPHILEDGRQCIYAASKCPDHQEKPSI